MSYHGTAATDSRLFWFVFGWIAYQLTLQATSGLIVEKSRSFNQLVGGATDKSTPLFTACACWCLKPPLLHHQKQHCGGPSSSRPKVDREGRSSGPSYINGRRTSLSARLKRSNGFFFVFQTDHLSYHSDASGLIAPYFKPKHHVRSKTLVRTRYSGRRLPLQLVTIPVPHLTSPKTAVSPSRQLVSRSNAARSRARRRGE